MNIREIQYSAQFEDEDRKDLLHILESNNDFKSIVDKWHKSSCGHILLTSGYDDKEPELDLLLIRFHYIDHHADVYIDKQEIPELLDYTVPLESFIKKCRKNNTYKIRELNLNKYEKKSGLKFSESLYGFLCPDKNAFLNFIAPYLKDHGSQVTLEKYVEPYYEEDSDVTLEEEGLSVDSLVSYTANYRLYDKNEKPLFGWDTYGYAMLV
jgi:hypothetical protein